MVDYSNARPHESESHTDRPTHIDTRLSPIRARTCWLAAKIGFSRGIEGERSLGILVGCAGWNMDLEGNEGEVDSLCNYRTQASWNTYSLQGDWWWFFKIQGQYNINTTGPK